MSTETAFEGRAWKRPLPVFQAPWGPGAPPLKRLALAQGELAQFHDAGFPVRYIASIELRPALPRGNHFHKLKREYVYLLAGELVLRLENLQNRQYSAFRVQTGDLVFVDAGIAHVLEPVTAGFAIEFSEEPFDSADTYKHVVREV